MAIETTTSLSGALRTRYLADYRRAALMVRLYDQFSTPFSADLDQPLAQGSSVTMNFLSDLAPATSVISELADLTPAQVREANTTVSPTSRANAIQVAEKLLARAYTNYGMERFEMIGKNMMESVDLVAQGVATKGTVVQSAAARASLDAGTSGHRLTDTTFSEAQITLETLKVPGFIDALGTTYMAAMHPYAYHDVRTSGNVVSIAQYQQAQIILAHELGMLGRFRFVVSPWAKVFWGAGEDNGSAVATTLNGAVNALGKSIILTAGTNIAANQWLNIGTEETADTHYPTNERVRTSSGTAAAATTVTIAGEGANGGLRFDHADDVAVRNADSVFTVTIGGPGSLAKVFHSDMGLGEFGTVVGPKKQGLVDQFESLGWKWYGAYGRPIESRILRVEVSSSFEA